MKQDKREQQNYKVRWGVSLRQFGSTRKQTHKQARERKRSSEVKEADNTE
jgi:hypothetical protein